MRLRWVCLWVISWCVIAAETVAPTVLCDRWYVGELNKQPALSMRMVVNQLADGSWRERCETVMALNRVLGNSNDSFAVRDTQVYTVAADGRVRGFIFDHVENGLTTSATGTVEGNTVKATVLRQGRVSEQTVAIPAGVTLLGQYAAQKQLARSTWEPGGQQVYGALLLEGAQVRVITTTATYLAALADGARSFRVTMEQIPIPSTMALDAQGDLITMTMDFGFAQVEFRPSAGPVVLTGARIPSAGLVQAAGPAPSAGAMNRVQVPVGATVPTDEFQQQVGAVVTLRSDASASELSERDAYLRATSQYELDDPELRAWALNISERAPRTPAAVAERLRLAVRSHFTKQDQALGDGSALEAFRSRAGDCTEHANLLTAALRIAGIPARVEVGLVYAADLGGWVGHAWNSAYVGDRWVHLDSAYPGIPRACYLKLGTTSDANSTGTAMFSSTRGLLGKTVTVLP